MVKLSASQIELTKILIECRAEGWYHIKYKWYSIVKEKYYKASSLVEAIKRAKQEYGIDVPVIITPAPTIRVNIDGARTKVAGRKED